MVDLSRLVANTIANDRSGFSCAVIISNNSRIVHQILEELPNGIRSVALTSSSNVFNKLKESDIESKLLEDSLSSQGLSVLVNLHDLVLQGLGEGNFNSSDRILAILGEPLSGLIVIEAKSLTSNRLAILSNEHEIDIEVLARVMELARNIGGRGREGHAVGALFAIGSVPKLRRYTTALVLNPFKGHSEARRNVIESNNHETLSEFAWLDGAILFNNKGVASDAGRYVQVPAGINPKPGEGGRHLAARAISQLAESIAICVSSSGTITIYSKGKEKYRVRLS